MSFEEWWFKTQFDAAYWEINSHKHQTEYRWAKLAWNAAQRATAQRCAEICKDKSEYYDVSNSAKTMVTLDAYDAIRKEFGI